MSGFSIDDVRETFTADITNFLGRIEEASRALLASPALEQTSLKDISGTPLFEKVGDFAHAISGTSSLVQAGSLAESARMLEHLAGKGLEEVRAIEAHAKEARRIAQHCAEGAAEMRSMLELELKHDSDEAEWLLLAFRDKLADILGTPVAEKVESPAYDAEVRASMAASGTPAANEAGEAIGTSPSQSPAFDEELQVIFREEVRESGEALARHVQSFIDDSDKMVSAGHIERILHGIKGGAGAAGFPEVHKLAEQLRRTFEGVIIGSVQVTPAFIQAAISDLDRMLTMAGAPRLGVMYKAEAAPAFEEAVELPSEELEVVAEGDLDTMFHDEARDLLVPLQGYLQKLLETPSDDASAKSVERIFHTLKGSASFAGLSNVSEAASELQSRMMGVVERTTPVTPGFLDQIARDTNRILRQVNLPEIAVGSGRGTPEADAEFSFAEEEQGPPPSRATGPEPILADRHAEFLALSKELLEPVQTHITALAQDATDLSAARKLEKIFEQLNALAQKHSLPQFAGMAVDLAKMMRDVADGRIDGGEDTLAAFALESNALLRKVDMKPITLTPPPMPGDSVSQSGSGDAEFSFAEDQGAEGEAEVDKELAAIFQEEARELVVALQGHLQALVSDPTNVASADHVERIYHTLKGAAATVGLKEVSKIAEGLQKRMESVLESGVEVDAPFLDALLGDTRKLLRLANLPELEVGAQKQAAKEPPSQAEPPSEVGDARKYFMEEARELCEKAGQLLEELSRAPDPRSRELRGELGKLFHRLKGSALVVAEDAIATEAARLQSLASADKTSAAVLQRGLARVTQLLQSEKGEEPSFSSAAQAARKPAKAPRVKEAVVRERVQLPAEPDLVDAFNQECSELLDQLDRAILALEETSQPKAALETLMRLTHTLKGAVNTIGLGPTGAILHRVESFLEGLLEATILPSMKAVATFLLEVQQDVRRNLRQAADGYVETSIARVESRIGNVLAGSKATYEPVSHTGGSSVSIINVDTGGGSGDAESLQAGPADAADRRFIRVSTERLDALMNLAGELVVSRSRLMSRIDVLKQLQQELGRSRRRLMDTVESFREEHEFTYRRPGEMQAAYQQQVAQLAGRDQTATQAAKALSVKAGDEMMGAFSEAELDRYDDVNVLARSLAEMSNDFNEMYGQLYRELTAFAADSEAHGSIVTGIQSEVTRARMVPLEFLFQRLRLPVRDAAAREGKEVRVVTSGEDVNIDKTIADALFGPMLHLVRNAVVHGIEAPSSRQAVGKKESGTLTLAARQESGQIVLEIRDDGNGLDLAALHAKGISMGIIPPETTVNDQIVKDLVFAAGLSTKATVGNVAGRGVGGNVVRRAVDRLNGSIRVDTIPGKGTAFLITLPLTLAITKALLVSNRGRSFAIPLYFCQHILDAEEGVIVESAGVRRVRLDDTYVTVLTMDELFGQGERDESKKGPVLVLRVGDQRLMLQVDAVIGQEEVVVKSLGDLLTGHPVLAGVTIRGTGELSLILDIPGVVEAHAGRTVSAGGPKITTALERAPKAREAARVQAAQRKLRVLFVDDSLSVRKIAEKELTNLGTEVTTAVDGLDAMSKLREGNFDIIFTDLEMPRMHGYDLIRELRFLPAYQELPIIVVSSRSGQKHQDQARALGCTDYLTKPFNARQLEGALDKYAGRKQKQLPAPTDDSSAASQSQDSGDSQ